MVTPLEGDKHINEVHLFEILIEEYNLNPKVRSLALSGTGFGATPVNPKVRNLALSGLLLPVVPQIEENQQKSMKIDVGSPQTSLWIGQGWFKSIWGPPEIALDRPGLA